MGYWSIAKSDLWEFYSCVNLMFVHDDDRGEAVQRSRSPPHEAWGNEEWPHERDSHPTDRYRHQTILEEYCATWLSVASSRLVTRRRHHGISCVIGRPLRISSSCTPSGFWHSIDKKQMVANRFSRKLFKHGRFSETQIVLFSDGHRRCPAFRWR